MHVHGNQLNPNVATLYAALAAESAARAKQAAEVRKKLISSASKLAGELGDDAVSFIGGDTEQDSGHPQKKQDPHASENSQNSDAPNDAANGAAGDTANHAPDNDPLSNANDDDGPSLDPISTWA
jgi:hypothetical protein